MAVIVEAGNQRRLIIKTRFARYEGNVSRAAVLMNVIAAGIALHYYPHTVVGINEEVDYVRNRDTGGVYFLEDALLPMIIIDTVAVLNNEQVSVVVLVHKEKLAEFVVVRDGVCSSVKTVQSVVCLYPEDIVTGVYDIVDKIAGQVIFLVAGFKLFNLLPIVNVEAVTSANPHYSTLVLAQ